MSRSLSLATTTLSVAATLAALTLAPRAAAQVPVPYARTHDWESTTGRYSTGGAFADLDRDGWPDFVASDGNDMRRERVNVHYNRGDGTFPKAPDWQSADIDYHGHLDVGDVNGDGWPDVVVAVFLGPNRFGDKGRAKLYLNDGKGRLGTTPAWTSADRFFSFSCRLGDVDLDGDLDLAVATGEPYQDPPDFDRIYLNQGGTFSAQPWWKSATTTHTMDTAWCDVDQDGDLDLCFLGSKGPHRVFLNQGGTIPTTPSWVNTDGGNSHDGNTAAWADVDGDGRPELVLSENKQWGPGTFRAYRNLGATYTPTPWWESQYFHNGYTSAVDFLDFDLDGDLDLVGGGWWTQTSWDRNASGSLPTSPTWETSGTSVVEALFFADVNRDGLRKVVGESKTVGGGRNLFRLDRRPVQSLTRVVADGAVLTPKDYAFHREDGWLTCVTPPTTSLKIDYVWTEAADLGVTNWDTSKGNFLFYRAPLVGIELSPPAKNTFRGGELIVWSETIANSAENGQFAYFRNFLDLPGGLGTFPWIQGGAVLPGAFRLGPYQHLLPIPNPIPAALLGTWAYRVEILGPDGTVMSDARFAFTLAP